MAKNFSKIELNKCMKHAYGKYYPVGNVNIFFKIIRLILRKYYIFKWVIFNYKQDFFKTLYGRKKKDFPILEFKIKNFEYKDDLIVKNFKKNGYVFIENFFDQNTYSLLKSNFPKFYNFKHTKNPLKNFFIFGSFVNGRNKNQLINKNYDGVYYSLFKFLSSEKFESLFNSFLSEFENNDFKVNFKSFVISVKKRDSYLIPHQDGITDGIKNVYNIIYFLDGNNNEIEFSAGTGIYKDNEFKKKLLIPSSLKNSCLIYKTSNENFFHGFDIVKKNCFAKVFTSEYTQSDQ